MTDELRKGPSGPPADTVNATVINDAIVAGEVPATQNDPGFISRHVYVNAASSAIGQTYAGVTIEAVTALTAANLPPGNRFTIDVFASGAGGSGGRAGFNITANIPGGCGGGGAAHNQNPVGIARQDVLAAIARAGGTLTPSIPLGAMGGAGVVGLNGDVTSNNVGGNGGQVTFGDLLTAFGGGGGGASLAPLVTTVMVGGAGGGIQSAGAGQATTFTTLAGGRPRNVNVVANGGPNSGFGGADVNPNISPAFESTWGGASGASQLTTNATDGSNGGDTSWGCAGGASASVRNSNNATPRTGGSGGCSNFPSNSTRAAPGAGAEGTTGVVGGNGATGATGIYPSGGNGGGAGGDARHTSGGGTSQGGRGGNGGFPGGGGGGGGAAMSPTTGTSTSGAGGNGGDACIVLTGWY